MSGQTDVGRAVVFLWLATLLRPYAADYRWLAKIYASVQPSETADTLLWMRLGAKTTELIAAHITGVTVDRTGLEEVVLDAGTVEASSSWASTSPRTTSNPGRRPPKTCLTASPPGLPASSPASRTRCTRAWPASTTTCVGRNSPKPRPASSSSRSCSSWPALTQIFLEFKPDATPEILERIVSDIDTIVRSVRFSGWQTSQPGDREVRKQLRLILKKYSLPMTGPLFDRAYAYDAQHY